MSLQALRSAYSSTISLGWGFLSAMSLPQKKEYHSSRSWYLASKWGNCGKEMMHMRSEFSVCPLELFSGSGSLPLFILLFSFPPIDSELPLGLDWSLIHLRQRRDDVFDLKPSNFTLGAVFPLFPEICIGALEFQLEPKWQGHFGNMIPTTHCLLSASSTQVQNVPVTIENGTEHVRAS